MKKFRILLFSVFMFPLGINAHEQDTLKNTVEVVAETPVEVIKVDSLQQEIDRLKGLIVQYKQSETSLNGKLYDYEQTIKVQDKKIKRLTIYLLFEDTMFVHLSNVCFRNSIIKTEVHQAP